MTGRACWRSRFGPFAPQERDPWVCPPEKHPSPALASDERPALLTEPLPRNTPSRGPGFRMQRHDRGTRKATKQTKIRLPGTRIQGEDFVGHDEPRLNGSGVGKRKASMYRLHSKAQVTLESSMPGNGPLQRGSVVPAVDVPPSIRTEPDVPHGTLLHRRIQPVVRVPYIHRSLAENSTNLEAPSMGLPRQHSPPWTEQKAESEAAHDACSMAVRVARGL